MPRHPRVLIINSDPDVRYLLRGLLHLFAEEVAEAASGAEALALAREWRPTVVVMDLRLAGLPGGYLLVRWLLEIDPNLPVVVYTDPATAKRALQVRGVTKVVVQGQHQLDALLTAVQDAHDGYSSASPSAPPGGGVAPARPAAGTALPCSAGRAHLPAHTAAPTGRR